MKIQKKIFSEKTFSLKCGNFEGGLDDKIRACSFWEIAFLLFLITIVSEN